jgi:hypothetical protein
MRHQIRLRVERHRLLAKRVIRRAEPVTLTDGQMESITAGSVQNVLRLTL